MTYTSVAEMTRSPKALPARAGVEPQQGELHDVAARVLLEVLWAARFCRRDMLRAVNRFATCVATWTIEHDLMLYRLMGPIASTRHLRMYCWAGESLAQIAPHVHADSDLEVVRQHSAVHLVVITYFVVRLHGSLSWVSVGDKVAYRTPRRRRTW